MGKGAQEPRAPNELPGESDTPYGAAAEAAFLRSACVTLVLQMPNVNLTVVAALYKAGFADGCMYGATESREAFEKVLASLASGRPH
jgi:hypothetical protein